MSYTFHINLTPIKGQGQGHQPPKVGNLVIYKMHLLRKFNSNSGFVYWKRLSTNMSTKWSKRFLIRFVVWQSRDLKVDLLWPWKFLSSDHDEIWCLGSTRCALHEYVLFAPIQGQGQGHQPAKVCILVFFKMHLLRHFDWNSRFIYRKRLSTNMS